MYSYFSTLTIKSLIVKSLQQLIYDIISTAVQAIASLAIKHITYQISCILSSKKYRKTSFKFREKYYQNISKFILLYLNMVDLQHGKEFVEACTQHWYR